MGTIQEIIEMPGVEFCGMLQMYDAFAVKFCLILICICIPAIIASVYMITKTQYEYVGLFIAIMAIFVLAIAMVMLPTFYCDKHTYVQLRVVHDSKAAFRIIEEFEDVEIDASTFTIRLDE